MKAQTWTPFTNLPVANWYSGSISPDGTKLVVTTQPPTAVYTSTNSGTTWITNMISEFAYPVSSLDGTKWVAPGSDAGVHLSTNSGVTWQSAGQNPPNTSSAIISADGNILAAGGFLNISTNMGNTWGIGSVQHLGFGVFLNNGRTWLSLESRGMYVSSDWGVTWISNSVPSTNLYMVAASADGRKLIASDVYYLNGQYLPRPLYISTNFGNSWFKANAPSNVWSRVACSADGNKLAATAWSVFSLNINGGLFTSTNGGIDWVSNNVPTGSWSWVAMSGDGSKLVAASDRIYKSFSPASIPQLNLTASNTNLTFSWLVPSTNFVLQQSSDLTAANWVTLTNQPTLNFSTLQNQVSLTPTNNSGFFRLTTQ